LIAYARFLATPVAVIRPFNTYGPRQSARAVIPTVITQIASGARRLRLGALHPTRNFNFVDDTVAGFMRVAECDAAVGEVINIGSGFEISIGDTVDLIAELMGREIEIDTDAQRLRPRESEVERLVAGIDKATRLLGHVPTYAGREGLCRGLEATIAWFEDRDNLVRYKADRYNL
jgi:nucleoside-diphosphate-sugar epimerase